MNKSSFFIVGKHAVIEALKKDIPVEKAIESIGQSEKDKWLLFDRVHPGNIVRTFMRYEWEY